MGPVNELGNCDHNRARLPFFSRVFSPCSLNRKMVAIHIHISFLIEDKPSLVYIIIRGPVAAAPPILCSHLTLVVLPGDPAGQWEMAFILGVPLAKPPFSLV